MSIQIPCKIPGLCINSCINRPICTKKRMSFIIYGVVIDRKANRVYDDIYLNYAVDEMLLSKAKPSDIVSSLVEIPCFGPGCNRSILTTSKEKGDLLLSFDEKYDKTVLPVCSKACQEKLIKMYKDSQGKKENLN